MYAENVDADARARGARVRWLVRARACILRACSRVCVCALCACVCTGARARARGHVSLTGGDHPHLLASPAGGVHAIFGHCVGPLLAGDFAGSHRQYLGGRVQAAGARLDAVVEGPGEG